MYVPEAVVKSIVYSLHTVIAPCGKYRLFAVRVSLGVREIIDGVAAN